MSHAGGQNRLTVGCGRAVLLMTPMGQFRRQKMAVRRNRAKIPAKSGKNPFSSWYLFHNLCVAENILLYIRCVVLYLVRLYDNEIRRYINVINVIMVYTYVTIYYYGNEISVPSHVLLLKLLHSSVNSPASKKIITLSLCCRPRRASGQTTPKTKPWM